MAALRLVAGFQEYVLAPAADIVVVDPLQMLAEPGVAVTVGNAFTVTVTDAVDAHPVTVLVPVTVYVAVAVPLNVTGEPVAELKLVAGVHE